MNLKRIHTLLFLLFTVVAFGQKPVQASIDSTKIKIGSQFNLTIKATADTTAKVNFPEGKNFGQLEVLESYPIDTLRKGAIYELVKKYGLTQFDSGRYVIPPLPVTINNKSLYTDSLAIEVHPIVVDTLKQQMYDIKPVIGPAGSYDWLWYLFVPLIVGAIVVGIWYYFEKKKKRAPKAKVVPDATPIEKATAQLKGLEQKELLQRGEIKEYYSELTDIARTYIEEAIHIPAMESTTGELIEAMQNAITRKKMSLSMETFRELEGILRTADMVKFAKSRPMDFEIAEDRNKIEKTITVIDKSIPAEVEDDQDAIASAKRREEALKKKKKQQIAVVAGIVTFIVVLFAVYYTGQYLRDNVVGRPTKELLEGEWVTSEYGEPPVKLETPKVLRRFIEKEIQDNLPPNVKAYQKFTYGGLNENLAIIVSTSAFNQETKLDAENIINNELAGYEKTAGASNIVLKIDEFSNENGLSGRRAYGTMNIVNPSTKESEKMYYTIMVFIQQNSAQEVIILHKDGDEDAQKITDRVINSVQLSKAVQ